MILLNSTNQSIDSPDSSHFCQLPDFWLKDGSGGFVRVNYREEHGSKPFWISIVGDRIPFVPGVDLSRKIAETPILSWRWAKRLPREDLRYIACRDRRDDLCSFKEMGNFEAQNSLSARVL